jgi:hypothetical protein
VAFTLGATSLGDAAEATVAVIASAQLIKIDAASPTVRGWRLAFVNVMLGTPQQVLAGVAN